MRHGDDQQGAGGQAPHGREPSPAEPRPPDQRRHRPRARRILAWTSAVLTTVLVAGALSTYAEYRSLVSKIKHVKVTDLGKRPARYNSSLNILVIGSDSRAGRNSRFGAGIQGQRSDTVMVLHLSPGRSRAIVMSIPRDSVVPVLACPAVPGAPGQSAQPGQVEQINATFALGGPGCLWKTVEQTTHIRLAHFIELNFIGFEKVINDIGGVNICLPYAIDDPHSKLRLSAGKHHVMGAQALAYWRVRYIGLGSDLERIQRDQYLMASVAQGVKRTNLLGDPSRVYKIVTDLVNSLTTDSQLSQATMISIAESLNSMPLKAVQFIQVPVLAYPPNPDWVEWAPQAGNLFSAISHDRKLRGLRRSHRPISAVPAGQVSVNPRPATPGPSPPAGAGITAAGKAATSARASLFDLTKTYGGITAGASVCRDSNAFAGPLGGH